MFPTLQGPDSFVVGHLSLAYLTGRLCARPSLAVDANLSQAGTAVHLYMYVAVFYCYLLNIPSYAHDPLAILAKPNGIQPCARET